MLVVINSGIKNSSNKNHSPSSYVMRTVACFHKCAIELGKLVGNCELRNLFLPHFRERPALVGEGLVVGEMPVEHVQLVHLHQVKGLTNSRRCFHNKLLICFE